MFYYIESELDFSPMDYAVPKGAFHAAPVLAWNPEHARAKYNVFLKALICEKFGLPKETIKLSDMMVSTTMKHVSILSCALAFRSRKAFIFFNSDHDGSEE